MPAFRSILVGLAVIAIAMAPLVYGEAMSRQMACCSANAQSADDANAAAPEMVSDTGASCCTLPTAPDQDSPPIEQMPDCNLCVCCPLARVLVADADLAHMLNPACCGRALVRENDLVNSRTLRPDPHPPKSA